MEVKFVYNTTNIYKLLSSRPDSLGVELSFVEAIASNLTASALLEIKNNDNLCILGKFPKMRKLWEIRVARGRGAKRMGVPVSAQSNAQGNAECLALELFTTFHSSFTVRTIKLPVA